MTSESGIYKYKELGECIDVVIDHRGKTPKKLNSDWVDNGIPTISAKNVNSGKLVAQDSIRYVTKEVYKKWMKDDVQRGDCFLVSEGATLGECLYWDNDYPIVLGQRIFCIRTNPDILYSRYFYAYMTSASFQSEIIGRSTGSSVSGLRQTEVLKLKVKILPMEQQLFIGDFLYNINKKIETNIETNQTLEQIAQAIFKSWFVDFEPVKAKMAAKQTGASAEHIEQAAICAISGKTSEQLAQLDPQTLQQLKTTAALFPDTLVDSELGEIPEGWQVGKLSHVITQRVERVTPSADTISKPYVPIECISTNSLYLRDFKSGEEANTSLTKVYRGDIIFGAMRSYFHKVCIAPFDATTRTTAFVLKPVSKSDFAFGTLRMHQKDTIDYATLHSTGSTIPYAKWDGSLSEMDIILPSMNIRERFNSIIEPIICSIPPMIFEELNLTQLRDSLLPKLLSGELSVNPESPALQEAL